ncbi:MAG: Ldh family oxidoreductase [Reyranella sp.]|uniref:Ldh family oxidoreductase n=1 Tax=Reyranella sp. TaxID=1929291 RepID=UPI003D0D651E
MKIAIEALTELVTLVLMRHGLSEGSASIVSRTIVAAERDGSRSHGLQRLAGYLSSLDSGWVNGRAIPILHERGSGALEVDAGNGFAQVALEHAAPTIRSMANHAGCAVMTTRNSHHFAALWPDIEPFAGDGLVALTMVNTRSRIVAWGGTRKVLGTNPMAFACPRKARPPVVWDQASSIMSQGDVLLVSAAKGQLPDKVGVDAQGQPTVDPDAVLEGGALLPFGGVKGGSLAFMIEILTAALGGARFGFEDGSGSIPGALTSNAGQFLLLIDPQKFGGAAFLDRVERLVAHLHDAGTARLPADLRYERRRVAERDGIDVAPAMHAYLEREAGGG